MMKKLLLISAFALTFVFPCRGYTVQPGETQAAIAVLNNYEKYREPVIKDRFFKHSDIMPLIKKHAGSGVFRHEAIGTSAQGRSINHLILGTGKTKVLLWSQMHGDESTATMALFDLFNFFAANDEHNELRKYLLDNLELHFVPMLNPDGAQVWKRRNALDIDVNRDARAQVTPEGRILLKLAQELKPDFGFNLHDQSMYYNAGPTDKTATISFLAPAFNYEKDMNDVRKRAMQVIVGMNSLLQKHIPGRVAKYNDDFEPRAFGDNIQRLGVSTILIESGGYPGDPEKQYIRKMNFYALLNAFEAIADRSYASEDIRAYEEIPQNHRSLYDLVIRNVETEIGGQTIRTNLCINRAQLKSADFRSVSYRGGIEEVGDLELVFGY
ncbi:MAG TPA: M14 family zinc carboxypeptidase, partial [Sphingobacteriaceae bacterium]